LPWNDEMSNANPRTSIGSWKVRERVGEAWMLPLTKKVQKRELA